MVVREAGQEKCLEKGAFATFACLFVSEEARIVLVKATEHVVAMLDVSFPTLEVATIKTFVIYHGSELM